MVANLAVVLILIALAGAFAWLTRRASRARFALLKWPGMLLAGLLTLAALALTAVLVIGLVKLNLAPNAYPASAVKVELTSAQVQRGEALAHICTGCHSSSGKLPLDGSGEDMLAVAPMPLGSMYAPNLTPGGPLKGWSDADILRALREGVDKNNRPLLGMPSVTFHNLSDADAAALVAYLRSQPTVERSLPERDLSPLAAMIVGVGMIPTSPQEPIAGPVDSPQPGTPEYGKYLITALGCVDCHGTDFKGRPAGGLGGPSGPNLSLIVPKWQLADFVSLFRSGKDPSGRLVGDGMPWKDYNPAFSDSDLADIYAFLHALK